MNIMRPIIPRIFLLALVANLFFFSCSSDDEDNCVDEEYYNPMTNNPTKTLDWIVDLIEVSADNSAFILLYQFEGKDYYLTDILPSQKFAKTSVRAADVYVYTADGEIYCSNFSSETGSIYREFIQEATFVAKLWEYKSCADLVVNY